MATQSVTQLKAIRDKIRDLSVHEEHAREMEGLVRESITLIGTLKNNDDGLFESRKRAALRGLEGEFSRYLESYWQQGDKLEKISQFSRAREHASDLLNSVLASFRK